MNNLESCPFCGCRIKTRYIPPEQGGPVWEFQHPKNDCFLSLFSIPYIIDFDEFMDRWNRRADDDADLLALFNGWLDSERYNCDNSEHD